MRRLNAELATARVRSLIRRTTTSKSSPPIFSTTSRAALQTGSARTRCHRSPTGPRGSHGARGAAARSTNPGWKTSDDSHRARCRKRRDEGPDEDRRRWLCQSRAHRSLGNFPGADRRTEPVLSIADAHHEDTNSTKVRAFVSHHTRTWFNPVLGGACWLDRGSPHALPARPSQVAAARQQSGTRTRGETVPAACAPSLRASPTRGNLRSRRGAGGSRTRGETRTPRAWHR